MMQRRGKKVSIIGAGNVGSTVAYSLAMNGTAHEIVLIDNKQDIATGKALDMSQASAVIRSHTVVRVAKEQSDIAGSDIVVVTAGSPRKPGMSRDDLLMINAEVMRSVMAYTKKYAPDAIVIIVTNPLDVMTYVTLKESGFDPSKVIGMAGILDGARMASFIYDKLGYGAGQIRATVMGGHGDTMVPLQSYSTVAGVPLTDVMPQSDIDEIVERTKHGGAEIVKYLQTGSAYYAPAKATALMCEAILKDAKQIYPCSAYLQGQYGYNDVYSGVPIVLGANGVEEILEVTLTEKEEEMFANSVQSVQGMIEVLNKNKFFG
jgi:malate dehydrogenase